MKVWKYKAQLFFDASKECVIVVKANSENKAKKFGHKEMETMYNTNMITDEKVTLLGEDVPIFRCAKCGTKIVEGQEIGYRINNDLYCRECYYDQKRKIIYICEDCGTKLTFNEDLIYTTKNGKYLCYSCCCKRMERNDDDI